ncbi:MAG: alpha-amylase family glycosyl hydrolase [Chloroflexota bacterium]|nr:alpha-amylase family glycosyl hydrolase [Chloroflexota bacterium]
MTAPWWKTGIIYQIYPRSFQDSNGDGVGDLRGIISRLDYLVWLGIDAIWLSPICQSPMKDFGYDISDYTAVDPLFGTLDDFDELIAEAAARQIKVVIDLVPSHTSDQHAWFIEARSSRDNPKRDWYIWADARADGSPPNNWLAYFGGPAWTWDAATGQYYMHNFLPEQPELNYRNPMVTEAMKGVVRFWLGRGVAGMRVDVIDRMLKDPEMRDNPPDPNYVEGVSNPQFKYLRVNSEQHRDVHGLVREFRRTFDEFGDRPIIGEINFTTDIAYITSHYGAALDEMQLPFNFAFLMLPWSAQAIRDFVDRYDAAVPDGGQPNYVLGNHDVSRMATRLGSAQARVAALLLLTLRGTPTLYYGDELGMEDVYIAPEQYQDPQGINIGYSRDPERTPMQWDITANAGFTTAQPWLPVAPDAMTRNVEVQGTQPDSVLALYRRMIAVRRATPALTTGSYRSADAKADDVFVYVRESGGQRVCVALNFGDRMQTLALRDLGQGRIVVSTHMDRTDAVDMGALYLRENEGVVVALG